MMAWSKTQKGANAVLRVLKEVGYPYQKRCRVVAHVLSVCEKHVMPEERVLKMPWKGPNQIS